MISTYRTRKCRNSALFIYLFFSYKVEKDIYDQLCLKNPVARFKSSCFRPNLFYDVVFQETSLDAETDLALYASQWLGDDWEEQPMVSD